MTPETELTRCHYRIGEKKTATRTERALLQKLLWPKNTPHFDKQGDTCFSTPDEGSSVFCGKTAVENVLPQGPSV